MEISIGGLVGEDSDGEAGGTSLGASGQMIRGTN
jgi:hypothetical protein